MLLSVDSDEDFIDEEGVTVATLRSLQSSGVYRSEFDTSEADGFAADYDTAFG